MLPDLDPARPRAWSEPGRTTREIVTGGWRTRRPVYVEATAPCRAACPAGEPVAHWLERARRGDWAGAWRLIRAENPLPAVTGRVCGHPCEAACNRGVHDGAVAVNALERFVGDWGLAHGRAAPVPARGARRVAVVGGGPAGLACAYHLRHLGHAVTIYEAEPRLGGLLRYGIPEYRLPAAVLDREIELILELGVDVATSCSVGPDSWPRLWASHDAIFLATGATRPLVLGVPGERAGGVVDGLVFLRSVRVGLARRIGPRVAVIGGGSTAMDVARSARRLGAPSVTVLALEPRDAMPALPDEVEQALAEGVAIVNGVGVARLVEIDGDVAGVVVRGARLERDAFGAVRPVLEDGPGRVVGADSVVLAVGQRPDPAVAPPDLRWRGTLVAVEDGGATSLPRVFAGGDATSMRRSVAEAIGAGTRAARSIHARLAGEVVQPLPDARAPVELRPAHVVAGTEVGLHHFAPARRASRRQRPAAARVESFVEVEESLGEDAALHEAARCFSCGRCVACDICVAVCPDVAITRAGDAYEVALDHCKGCGLCAAECPRAALEMVGER
jgi:NADPH-dependent glutamate synthase beta subunit-like oxidoreductase